MRRALLAMAPTRVLTDTDVQLPGFNRHGTAHGRLGQFGESQMLEALLLVSAWLREWVFTSQWASLVPGSEEGTGHLQGT